MEQVIERIHRNFFSHERLDDVDVRNILVFEQRKILAGCRIVFSRVFPVGEVNPQLHPLWQTAEQFGAVCTNQIDEQVTHVVANSLGTDKVNCISLCSLQECYGKSVWDVMNISYSCLTSSLSRY